MGNLLRALPGVSFSKQTCHYRRYCASTEEESKPQTAVGVYLVCGYNVSAEVFIISRIIIAAILRALMCLTLF